MKLGIAAQGTDLDYIEHTVGSDEDFQKILDNLVPDFLAVGSGVSQSLSTTYVKTIVKICDHAKVSKTPVYIVHFFHSAVAAEIQRAEIEHILLQVGVENVAGVIIRCRESVARAELHRIKYLVKWNYGVPVGVCGSMDQFLKKGSEARTALEMLDPDEGFIVPLITNQQDPDQVALSFNQLWDQGFKHLFIPALLIIGSTEGLQHFGQVMSETVDQMFLWSWQSALHLEIWQTFVEVSMGRRKQVKPPPLPSEFNVTHQGTVLHAGLAKRSAPSPAAKVLGGLAEHEVVQIIRLEGTNETRSLYALTIEKYWVLVRQGKEVYIDLVAL